MSSGYDTRSNSHGGGGAPSLQAGTVAGVGPAHGEGGSSGGLSGDANIMNNNNNQNNSSNSAPISPPLTIVFENVTVVGQHSKQVVLDEVSGVIRGGRLTAIVSCCGARGDYYLLNALAGHLPAQSGSIWANGVPVMSKTYRRGAAFIDEEVTTFEDLTVHENLTYSARMRSSSYDSQEIEHIIDDLELRRYTRMRLADCPTFARRRVLLGKELVLDPFLLCVDSAVQGLTSDRAVITLRMLREMAMRENRAVVITMVQPRWSLLQHVDDVLLVEGNKVVFIGSTEEVLAATRKVSLSYGGGGGGGAGNKAGGGRGGGDRLTYRLSSSSAAAVAAPANHIALDSPEHLINDLYRVASNPTTSLGDLLFREGRMPEIEAQIVEYLTRFAGGEGGSLPPRKVRIQPSALRKLFYLFNSTFCEIRNNILVYIIFASMLLLISLALAIIYKAQTGQTGMQNRIGIIFFLVSSTFLHNILIVDRQRKSYNAFLRHWQHGYFGPATFLIHWVISSAFFRFAMCAFFTVIVYSLANVGSSWDFTSLSDLVIVVALTSFTTAIFVFLVCITVPTTRIAHFILFTIYAINVILAGIILNVSTLPKFFQVVSLGTSIRLGYESAVLSQFEGQGFGCAVKNGVVRRRNQGARGFASADADSSSDSFLVGGDAVSPSSSTFASAIRAFFFNKHHDNSAVVLSSDALIPSEDVREGAAFRPAGSSFGNETTTTTTTTTAPAPIPQACYTGDEYLIFLGFDHDRKWSNLMIMEIEAGVFIILAYIVMLIFRTPKKIR